MNRWAGEKSSLQAAVGARWWGGAGPQHHMNLGGGDARAPVGTTPDGKKPNRGQYQCGESHRGQQVQQEGPVHGRAGAIIHRRHDGSGRGAETDCGGQRGKLGPVSRNGTVGGQLMQGSSRKSLFRGCAGWCQIGPPPGETRLTPPFSSLGDCQDPKGTVRGLSEPYLIVRVGPDSKSKCGAG